MRVTLSLLARFKDNNIAVFIVPVPIAGFDLWDHVPAHHVSWRGVLPYNYNCSTIRAGYTGMCNPYCDMCEKNRSTGIIEAAIDKAAALGYTEQVLMGWSSGGTMASAFLDHAFKTNSVTAHNTSYSVKGMVMISAGGQYCYAYLSRQDLASSPGSSHWSTCTHNNPAKIYGCCPQNLTEDYFWHRPQEYRRRPPTLLVQSVLDSDADWDAARFYHAELVAHGATSTHFAVGGDNHPVNPAIFGVVASFVLDLLGR